MLIQKLIDEYNVYKVDDNVFDKSSELHEGMIWVWTL